MELQKETRIPHTFLILKLLSYNSLLEIFKLSYNPRALYLLLYVQTLNKFRQRIYVIRFQMTKVSQENFLDPLYYTHATHAVRLSRPTVSGHLETAKSPRGFFKVSRAPVSRGLDFASQLPRVSLSSTRWATRKPVLQVYIPVPTVVHVA